MLEIRNLQVKYDDFLALDIDKSIHIKPGDRVGIIGSNGAGKTTLLKAILGLVSYQGEINTKLSLNDIGVHLQYNNYVNTMKVKYIIEAVLNTSIKENETLQELIEFFDFQDSLNKKFKQLSGGYRQRLTLILILMKDLPLVFFDEVTSGLDFETRQKLMDKISQWYQDKNTTLGVISHYYDELERLINKALIIHEGKLVDYGCTKELFIEYCGNTVVSIPNTLENEMLVKDYERITSPKNLITLKCLNTLIEKELIDLFIANNINYKRSNYDLELLYLNAIKQFKVGNNYEK